jgi:predicted dehydrogenase
MSNSTALIVGMGFGKDVYLPIYNQLGFDVVTVDPSRPATHATVQQAIDACESFRTVHVCTPNHTHESIVNTVAPYADIVFVEKPGVIDHVTWAKLIKDHINTTRIMMVKNNQYREEIPQFRQLLRDAYQITVNWQNKHRVPNPGTWFTEKQLSFGGVSRDLMPHLLSYFTHLTDYIGSTKQYVSAVQSQSLQQITHSDYGTVNLNGVYDVDDHCVFKFLDPNGVLWELTACWQNNTHDDSSITFHLPNYDPVKFQLGLCPESAYKSMICTALRNIHDDVFWKYQYEQDMWIHRQVDVI